MQCTGPEVSDVELCRDVVHRLCQPALCPQVTSVLTVSQEFCETTLLTRGGCTTESFAFSAPARNRVLSCRLPLLRKGDGVEAHPACEDVAEVFDRCDDVVVFFGGTPP